MFKGSTRRDPLRGQRGIASLYDFTEENPDMDFLIIARLHCWCSLWPNFYRVVSYKDGKMAQDSPQAHCDTTDVYLTTRLKNALGSIMKRVPPRFPGYEHAWSSLTIRKPYIESYSYNRAILDLTENTELEVPK